MLAQEAALKEIANSKLRRVLAINNSFDSVDVSAGGLKFFFAPPRSRPAKVPLLDESGVTLLFQRQSFIVARHCVRRKVRASAAPEASCDDVFDDLCRPRQWKR